MRKDEFPIIEKHVKNEINAVLDKMRAEITAKFDDRPSSYNHEQRREFYRDVLLIIDKCRKEQE